jgi:3-deoxy-7-phosphoheptulonate synthase
VSDGDQRIMGVMIESNLLEGNQKLSASPLVKGLSVTDACIGWETTEQLFSDLSQSVAARRKVG